MNTPTAPRQPSGLSAFLRASSEGKSHPVPPEAKAIQRKYGFGGKLPRAVVATLLTAFALSMARPVAHAAPAPSGEEAVAMHALTPPPAPPAVSAQNPDLAGPSRLWSGDAAILTIGEQHRAAGQSRIILRDLPYLKSQGMTAFAMELSDEKSVNKFLAGKMDKDGLARAMWESSYDKLPEGFQLKLDMVEWCRDNGVRVPCLDANRGLLYECASAQIRALQEGGKGFVDPTGEREVRNRGMIPRHTSMTPTEAAQEGWRLWLYERSKSMANVLAKDLKKHGGKTVALVGAMHTGLAGYRGMLVSGGVPIDKTPNEGIKDLLPDDLQARAQSIIFVGGMDYTGRLEDLPGTGTLHAAEAQIIRQGLGRQTLSIKRMEGLGSVDSVIYVPPVDKTPRVAVAAANVARPDNPDL